MRRLPKKITTVGLTALAFIVGFSLAEIPSAAAATYAYTPSNLISDNIFTDASTMSKNAIQTFLNNENSGLKNYKDVENCGSSSGAHYAYYKQYYHCGDSETAAQIIYDAAHAYDINPQAIMATMEKEQSLITTPNPTSSQINCAMGYNSCHGYVGLFYQIDNGTWQLKTYMELMDGHNWWGYTPSSYPCSTATSLYSAGLYPGNTVRFANPGGTAETVTLTDSATAALYCYTPYVGPYSLTGYSGSYNFVESFEEWFGSTVYPYAGEATATTYSDPARTQQLSLSGALPSNTKIYVTVSALNTGSRTWSNSFTKLATEDPDNRSSAFQDSSWLSSNRPAALMQSSVAPGQTGTFEFSMTTPNIDGTYPENFGLVADGQGSGWMQDTSTFGFDITVTNPYNGTISQRSTYRDSGYSLPVDTSVMTYGEKAYIKLSIKNIGALTWSNSFTKLATEDPDNRSSAFQDSSWLSSNRPAALMQSSVAPGQTGTFEFSITAPNTPGTYNESFGLVADGQGSGWMPAPTFTIPIRVVDPPLNTLYSGAKLYTGQSLESTTGGYTLSMQNDGNLVIYSPKGAIWGSGTQNKNASYVTMQTDGNLVIYGTNGKAIWGSGTSGDGTSSLDMQGDGNLVIYNAQGKPTWGSGTSHNISNTLSSLSPDTSLSVGNELMSANRRYRVVMQGDGNLVIYSPKGAIWGSGTKGKHGTRVVMQGDGNLVIYSPKGAIWGSGTNGHSSSTLDMQGDGNLVIYSAKGKPIWASGTHNKT